MPHEHQLIEVTSQNVYRVASGAVLVAGRNRQADIVLLDAGCSRQQFQVECRDGEFWLTPLSPTVPTLVAGVVAAGPVLLRDGNLIRTGGTTFEVRTVQAATAGEVRDGGSKSDDPPVQIPLMTQAMTLDPETGAPLPSLTGGASFAGSGFQPVPVSGETVIGRDESADVCLPHIQVSRRHALIQMRNGAAIVRDLHSTNGTFVDGRRIAAPVALHPGSQIGIGPCVLIWTGSALIPSTRANNLQLEGRELTRRAGPVTRPVVILDRVSVVVRPGEFVCLLGPTGSGKSTLLSALSARVPAHGGQVLINQLDLYQNFEALKQDIAVVPQHDILHDALTLRDALACTARLRLPVDTSPREIADRILELARLTGLEPHLSSRLGAMSGGQRRRASLASELVSNPGLIFLDEVTSGLDEHTDRQMMRLFRSLADSGRTVVCVTHSLANLPENCHLIVLLTIGGKLAFIGTPLEALAYFGIEQLGLVYERLADPMQAVELQRRFEQSALYERYVRSRMSPGAIPGERDNRLRERRFLRDQWAQSRHQVPLLLGRYFKVFCSDRRSLQGLLLQVLIVAVVLYLVFGDLTTGASHPFEEATRACQVLFVLAVSCFWFGCNNSAREIVKERSIYSRELLVNLSPASYLSSKLLLQFVVAALQSLLLLSLVDAWCRVPGQLVSQGLILMMAAAAGVVLGLFLSTVALTQEIALTLVPLVLIPQIILSDVFVKLTGLSRWLGQTLVSSYWTYAALRGTLPQNLVDQLTILPRSITSSSFALFMQAVALAIGSVAVLHVRDRVMACSNKSLEEAVSELPLIGPWLGRFLSRLFRTTRRT